jgi:L-2-hydroxyglutarate oxidase LhgO
MEYKKHDIDKVTIVGGGIIGCSVAYYLHEIYGIKS